MVPTYVSRLGTYLYFESNKTANSKNMILKNISKNKIHTRERIQRKLIKALKPIAICETCNEMAKSLESLVVEEWTIKRSRKQKLEISNSFNEKNEYQEEGFWTVAHYEEEWEGWFSLEIICCFIKEHLHGTGTLSPKSRRLNGQNSIINNKSSQHISN